MKPGKTRVQTLWNMVLKMHEGEITAAVRKEKEILKLGEHLFNTHGYDPTKHEYIRHRMRETTRLLLQGKKNEKLQTMFDFFVPANFPRVIEAVQKVAGLNEETRKFKTPS